MRLRWVLTIALLAMLVAAGGIGYTLYDQYWTQLPPSTRLVSYDPPVATRIYANDGSLVGEFYLEKRYLTPIGQIPDVLRAAFVAAEDSSFYTHPGIDFLGISRAVLANYRAGDVVQGGSTITQQVVKALLLSPERSLRRKIREAMLSLKIEHELTKDEILYLYLNQIYLGDGNYGVGAAADSYFGKSVADLDLAEAALLAGLPKAPSRNSPRRNPEGALSRQRYVLRRMLDENYITLGQYESALRRGLPLGNRSGDRAEAGSYYVDIVRRQLIEKFGTDAPYHKGYRVYTALDPELQKLAETTIRAGIEKLDVEFGYLGPLRALSQDELSERLARDRSSPGLLQLVAGGVYEAVVTAAKSAAATVAVGPHVATLDVSGLRWHPDFDPSARVLRVGDVVEVAAVDTNGNLALALTQTPKVAAALVSMDPISGHVHAVVGGYDFAASPFNRATQAYRQPGSSFKPLVYAGALDRGYTPASVVLDAPIEFMDHNRVWKPQNYSRDYAGRMSLRRALEQSRNVVTVRVVQDVGVGWLVRYLNERFSFSRPLGRNLSIGLGTSEVTPLELASAYTAFPGGGMRAKPVFITRVEDSDGKLIEENRGERIEALSPETAYLVTSMLEGVVSRGTGRAARVLNRPVAGKTGTTNNQVDAWFVGFTPDMLTAVWVGYDDRHSLGPQNTGGKIAAPLWANYMLKALAHRSVADFDVPEGVRCVNIDPASGLRARPDNMRAYLECFKLGTEPREFTPLWPTEPQPGAPEMASPGAPGAPAAAAPGSPPLPVSPSSSASPGTPVPAPLPSAPGSPAPQGGGAPGSLGPQPQVRGGGAAAASIVPPGRGALPTAAGSPPSAQMSQ
jgi:penicillin-binding protein 1A